MKIVNQMIKIERKSEGASVLRGDDCWDTVTDIEFKVKIFGITVFTRRQERKWDFTEGKMRKTGFNNGVE